MRARADEVSQQVRAALARQREVDLDTNFFEAGLSSAMLAEALADLTSRGLSVALLDMYSYPTVRSLAAELRRRASGVQTGPVAGLPWHGSRAQDTKN